MVKGKKTKEEINLEKKISRDKKKSESEAALKPVSQEMIGAVIPSRAFSTNTDSDMYLRYPILSSAPLPYRFNNGIMMVREPIILCQKAYSRIPIFKNTIDTMTELSNSDIYLTGGNAESTDFFNAWMKRIGIFKLKEQFYRELFRSGSIIFYRIDGKMTPDGAKQLKKVYAKAAKINIPLRYILLNPANVGVIANSLGSESPIYFRLIDSFQSELLKNSPNEDDKDLYDNLPDAIKNYFNGTNPTQAKPIPLDPTLIHTVFYKKQDYEPFPIPMGFPVLDSIELKLAMQKCDSIIARTVEHVMLVVTTGASKAEGGINPVSYAALKEAFSKEQIGRVLVADYTTKAEFVIPDLNKIFGSEKYEVVNQDISDGLFNVLGGGEGEKFSNMMGKIKVFVEKINNAQEIFVNEFLQPEIKRISKLMGFKVYPSAEFVEASLDDPTNLYRIYSQLMQMGILTAKDGLQLMETGEYPDFSALYQNQQDYKKDKDKGLWQPLGGGPWAQIQLAEIAAGNAVDLQNSQQEFQQKQTKSAQQHELNKPAVPPAPQIHINSPNVKTGQPVNPSIKKNNSAPNGRPPGIKTPLSTRKAPSQSSNSSFSMAKMIEAAKSYSSLELELVKNYKKINKIKELQDSDYQNINGIAKSILENEDISDWTIKTKEYITDPKPPNLDNIMKIEELSGEYGVGYHSAALLYHSLIESENNTESEEDQSE